MWMIASRGKFGYSLLKINKSVEETCIDQITSESDDPSFRQLVTEILSCPSLRHPGKVSQASMPA